MNTHFVPEWAKGIVWYQIFPERFLNGDPNNGPRLKDQRNAWPFDQTGLFEIHPWTAEWYKRQPYEQNNGLDIWQTIYRRRYGGDIQGIMSRLNYLADLGIGGIYLNPVFEAPSEHKYDGATYHHIDPNFGPDPGGDRRLIAAEQPQDPTTWVWTHADNLMLELIAEVHRHGMRIIFDGVFNHMGLNSWISRSVLAHQQSSLFADWLKIKSWRDEAKGTPFRCKGWCGTYFNAHPRQLPIVQNDLRRSGNRRLPSGCAAIHKKASESPGQGRRRIGDASDYVVEKDKEAGDRGGGALIFNKGYFLDNPMKSRY